MFCFQAYYILQLGNSFVFFHLRKNLSLGSVLPSFLGNSPGILLEKLSSFKHVLFSCLGYSTTRQFFRKDLSLSSCSTITFQIFHVFAPFPLPSLTHIRWWGISKSPDHSADFRFPCPPNVCNNSTVNMGLVCLSTTFHEI